MARIVFRVRMTSIHDSTQELVLTGEDVPDGWDQMTDDQKETAIRPALTAFLENEVEWGWSED